MGKDNVLLKMRGVKKSFGATQALRGIDLDICKNEVHAIVGSNGAGKSTLMKILAGEYTPDEGEIFHQGDNITGLSPKQIQSKGIEVVHQVLNIVDSMTIMENILLGNFPMIRGRLDWKAGEKKVREVFEYIGIDMEPYKTAGSLSISEQQFVILARALVNRPKILVLDEPTSRIGMKETDRLFQLIGKLKESGTTTIYISHRMEEIYRICSTISVFRDGMRIETRDAASFPEDELVAMMLGKKLDAFFPKSEAKIGEEVLSVQNLTFGDKVNHVDFSLRRGEIVSLVGAVGAGKTEIVNSIFGIIRPDGGDIRVSGKSIIKNLTPKKAIQKGIALVPEDRALQGMIGAYPVKNNTTSVNMKAISKGSLINKKKEDKAAQEMNDRLLVHPNDINYTIQSLSGGNQQKVVIGKWLTDTYKVYLLDEVAAGVDVGAKFEIYKLLGILAGEGAGVVLSTGDIEEAMGLSDRILILYKGRIVKEVDPKTTTKDEILTYIMGGGTNEF